MCGGRRTTRKKKRTTGENRRDIQNEEKTLRGITQPPLDRNNGAHKGESVSPVEWTKRSRVFSVCTGHFVHPPCFTLSLSLSYIYTSLAHIRLYLLFCHGRSPCDVATRCKVLPPYCVSQNWPVTYTFTRVECERGRTVNREQESLLRAVMLGRVCKIARLLLAENAIQCGASSTSGEVKRRVLPELQGIRLLFRINRKTIVSANSRF